MKTVFGSIKTESGSLSRVLKHLDGKFGVVSAYRDDNTEEENLELHVELKQEVRANKYGFIELASYWEEKGKVSREQSLFVSNASFDDIVSLGNKYKQYSVLSGDIGIIKLVCISYDDAGKILNTFTKSKVSSDDFKEMFAQLKIVDSEDMQLQLQSVTEVHRPHGLPIRG